MTQYQVRFGFEHSILPTGFYTDQLKFIGMLLNDKNSLYYVIKGMHEEQGLECPYTEDQFNVEAVKLSKDISLLIITFPEPEQGPLCYKSYLFFDEDFGRSMYFCIEKNSENVPTVCAWNQNGEHAEYMACSFEDSDDFVKCSTIFKSEFDID